MRAHFKHAKDTIGMNLAALERISMAIEERGKYGGGFADFYPI
jgi:hypothetical protein